MNERHIHRIFEISILLKGLHALTECIGGIALYLVPSAAITHWVAILTQQELLEDPHDMVAGYLLNAAQHLSVGTQTFYALYLLSHGLVKVLLVVGLLREKLWAYPSSLVALAAFVAYQLYRYSYTHSPGLIVLTVFDVFIAVLVWHEWRYLGRHIRRHS
jgi:uncharacterized membrane protein